jgi:positive regulator of sigma E activity
MRENGVVIKVTDRRADVAIEHARATGVHACGGCTICKPRGGHRFVLSVPPGKLSENDRVTVEIPVPSPWRGIILVFGLPVLALMVGLAVGTYWTGLHDWLGFGTEGTALVTGVVFALAAFGLAFLEDRRFRRKHRPHVVDVEPSSPGGAETESSP